MISMLADKFRMFTWLVLGLVMYLMAILFGVGMDLPAVQTVFQKLGHVTTLAWIGYWISRQAIGRLDDESHSLDKLARAVVIGAAIIGGSMGM